MAKFIRTIAFVAVIAGLLAWGMATMAKAPVNSNTSNVKVLHGQTLDNGVEADPSQFKRVTK